MTESTSLHCYAHPDRETTLRCKRCDKPMCASCARHTPTGYVCKECQREQLKKFDTAIWSDYLIVFFISAFLSGIAALLMIPLSGFFWGLGVIFLAPLAGRTIANGARRFIKNRRSPALSYTLAAGMILGALPILLFSGLPALFLLLSQGGDMSALFAFYPLLWEIVYLVLAVPTAHAQFNGLIFRL
ncbi:MAG: hypothetical protein Fur002_19870 [Anaerolineales bacterium]